jgi:uncharacterized repeat protein (TIGR01451 family)
MATPRICCFILAILLGSVPTLSAQYNPYPQQSREPPLVGKDDIQPVRGGPYDPDEGIRPAQYTEPPRISNPQIPRPIPPTMLEGEGQPASPITPGVVPAAGVQPTILQPYGQPYPTTQPSIVQPYTYPGYTYPSGTLVSAPGEIPTPTVTLHIEGTEVVPSSQAVIYKLIVRNVSQAKARNVVVRVIPPKNAEKVKADPPATADEAETRWEIKTLEPGQTRTIEVTYRPKPGAEDIKVEARVQFDFGRGMITHVAPPKLEIKKDGPEKVVLGDVATYQITVKNTGRVSIQDIEIRETLNKGLVYEDRELGRGTTDGKLMSTFDPKTGDRSWNILVLAPGQQRVIQYRVKAATVGKIGSVVWAKASDVQQKADFDTEVLTANLQMKVDGPASEKGLVGQPAAYRIVVSNQGSAELKNVCVRGLFSPDMRPTRATNSGQPFRDNVQWIFDKLKPGETKELNLALVTETPGLRTVEFKARADKGGEQKAAIKTQFAGISALSWDSDVPGIGTVGKPMTYQVTVANTGSAVAQGVQLRVDLPTNVDFVSSQPDAGQGVGANSKQVIFQAIDIPAGKKTTYKITVKAHTAGDARAVFQLFNSGNPDPSEHRKSTTITGSDTRSPVGPPPKIDPTTVGSSPVK